MKKYLLIAAILVIGCSEEKKPRIEAIARGLQVGMTFDEVKQTLGVPDKVVLGHLSPERSNRLKPVVRNEQELTDSLGKLSSTEKQDYIPNFWLSDSECAEKDLYTSYLYHDTSSGWTYLQAYDTTVRRQAHYYVLLYPTLADIRKEWQEVDKKDYDGWVYSEIYPRKVVWRSHRKVVANGIDRVRVSGLTSTVVTFLNSTGRVSHIEHNVPTFLRRDEDVK
jgi:hypothetical protein